MGIGKAAGRRLAVMAGMGAAIAVVVAGNVGAVRFAVPARVTPGVTTDGGMRLHNGWKITPAGDRHETVADMLLGSALSPDGKTLAVVSAGYGAHTLNLLDALSGKLLGEVPMLQAWNGVVWATDNKTVYVGGGASTVIHTVVRKADGTWEAGDNLTLQGTKIDRKAYLSGLALSPDGKTLYVANILTDTIYALNPTEGGKIGTARALDAGVRPYALRTGPDGTLYVGEWGNERVSVLDPKTLETRKTFVVGGHPNDLLLTPDNKRLFVSCGNADAVDVIDLSSGKVTERVRLTLTPLSPPGATPCSLSLTPDGKTLFVANSDNNDVAVVDVSRPFQSRVTGFIPTGWYPTTVAVSADGKRLFIGSGKGMGTTPNATKPVTPDTIAPAGSFKYIGTLMHGIVSTLPVPNEARLAAYTRQVLANTPYANDAMIGQPAAAPPSGATAIPSRLGEVSPIKHILYIIKENRTYDQVFGDMKDASGKPIGNGDPNYTLFGEPITPNHHALARQYVLLDNTYCNGEVSADGHPWSDAAIATDFTQRTWPVSYSKKGDPPANAGVTTPASGFVWDACARKKLSYRSYGEQTFAVGTDAPPQPLESADGATSLKGHASRAWQQAKKGGRDYQKADIFIDELKEFERNDSLPAFMVMSLGENHTQGTKIGAFTPKAAVASNDVGLGKIVDALSHSKYWASTAIFVIEDDAQNGPDHVDAHRTSALVISPYTKRGAVDSTFYTTASLLRTMELILGLPPMTQYDAAATPLYASFTAKADLTPYTALSEQVNLNAVNGKVAWGAKRMASIDFSEYDQLTRDDENALNRALWYSVKGVNVPYPAPVRRALVESKTGRSAVPVMAESERESPGHDRD